MEQYKELETFTTYRFNPITGKYYITSKRSNDDKKRQNKISEILKTQKPNQLTL